MLKPCHFTFNKLRKTTASSFGIFVKASRYFLLEVHFNKVKGEAKSLSNFLSGKFRRTKRLVTVVTSLAGQDTDAEHAKELKRENNY